MKEGSYSILIRTQTFSRLHRVSEIVYCGRDEHLCACHLKNICRRMSQCFSCLLYLIWENMFSQHKQNKVSVVFFFPMHGNIYLQYPHKLSVASKSV